MSVSAHIRFVLVGTQHPGNIGSAARAMKTMGLSHLVLVNPSRFPDPEAVARAAGAEDVVLCADTTVALGRRILGKPADAGEAAAFLTALGGRRHQVITAIAVLGIIAALIWLQRQRRARLMEMERLRQRIAQDLHDEIGSSLGSIALIAQDIRIDDPHDPRLADFRDLTRADRRPDRPGGRGLVIAEGTVVVRRLLASPYPLRALLGLARRYDELAGRPGPLADLLAAREVLV